MKTLLITPYWYPWNTSGTMRWLHIGQYINFDVLTSKEPRNGFYDLSLPSNPDIIVRRFGTRWPAFIWGLLAIFRTPIWKYDRFIITSPPESLIITGWILEKIFRRKVLLDMRDAIDRKNQKLKVFSWVYKFFYRFMNNVIVAWQFIDPDKPAIHHGYVDIRPKTNVPIYHSPRRYDYQTYLNRLEIGVLPDYREKNVDWLNYAASSYPTLKHMGFEANVKMHPETQDFPLRSWDEVASLMLLFILPIGEEFLHGA